MQRRQHVQGLQSRRKCRCTLAFELVAPESFGATHVRSMSMTPCQRSQPQMKRRQLRHGLQSRSKSRCSLAAECVVPATVQDDWDQPRSSQAERTNSKRSHASLVMVCKAGASVATPSWPRLLFLMKKKNKKQMIGISADVFMQKAPTPDRARSALTWLAEPGQALRLPRDRACCS
jgi:hypothetical protein